MEKQKWKREKKIFPSFPFLIELILVINWNTLYIKVYEEKQWKITSKSNEKQKRGKFNFLFVATFLDLQLEEGHGIWEDWFIGFALIMDGLKVNQGYWPF